MSYFDQKQKQQREYVEIFELELDINDPSRDAEWAADPNSFGTPKTTDDPSAYTGTDFRYYRYSQTYIPNLQCFGTSKLSITNASSPKVDPSNSIGLRASLTVSVDSFRDSDAYSLQGPYVDKAVRDTDHFCKLFARNYIKNKKAYVYRGYLVNGLFDVNNFKREAYIVDSFQNPKNNTVTFVLKDVLSLADIRNKKYPEQTNGVLAFDINNSVTTLTFSPSKEEEYGSVGATGTIAINDEFMDFTITSATTMTVVRGVGGTVAAEHSAADTIQLCVSKSQNIIDWFTDLIEFSDIPDSYIDPDWQNLKNTDLSNYNLTRVLFKPESIEKYLNELVVVGGLSVWTDVVAEKIKIQTAPEFDTSVYTFTEDDYLNKKFSINRDDNKHVNSQIILWGKVDPTKTDEYLYKSFQSVSANIIPQQLGYISQGKNIKTEWLTGLDSIAAGIANRTVQRFDEPPFQVEFDVDASRVYELTNGNNMDIGQVFEYETPVRFETDRFGNPVKRFAQCTGLKQTRDKYWTVTGLSYKANIPTNVDYYIDSNLFDVDLSVLLQDVPDFVGNVAREYVVVVSQGIVIGSTQSGINNYAINQGAFPAGATLKLIVAGEVIGKGGSGGAGGLVIWEDTQTPDPKISTGQNGGDASSAIIFTTDAVIDNLTGLIGGGGGGGQGGTSSAGSAYHIAGGGGGEGAGSNPSGGGAGGKSERNAIEITGDAGAAGTKTTGGLGGDYNALSGNATSINNGYNGGGLGEGGSGANGGDAGYAINKNGFNVTILAGENPEQIKGLIIG